MLLLMLVYAPTGWPRNARGNRRAHPDRPYPQVQVLNAVSTRRDSGKTSMFGVRPRATKSAKVWAAFRYSCASVSAAERTSSPFGIELARRRLTQHQLFCWRRREVMLVFMEGVSSSEDAIRMSNCCQRPSCGKCLRRSRHGSCRSRQGTAGSAVAAVVDPGAGERGSSPRSASAHLRLAPSVSP